jgi:phage repressor protein C with HTH and peptisase S24 domain
MERKTTKSPPNRVREHRKRAGLTLDGLGARIGLSASQVSRLESGEHRLTADKISEIARALGIAPADLINHDVTAGLQKGRADSHNPAAARLNYGDRNFPIYGSARAGLDGIYMDTDPIAFTHTPPELIGVNGAYGVNVVSDSMEPFVRNGDHVHVNPHIPPRPGSFVVVHLDDDTAMVKRLVRRTAERVILEQLNPPGEIEIETRRVRNLHWVCGTALLR